MNDIASIGTDISIYDTSIKKAENVLDTQLGSLVYATDFGIDKRYFLQEGFQFQNESFRAYCLQRLAESGIDVLSVMSVVNTFTNELTFTLPAQVENSGLVR